jgi:hypothetical protein
MTTRKYYKLHREEILQKQQEYYKDNRENVRKRNKKYYKTHKAECNARSAIYRATHRAIFNEMGRQRYYQGREIPEKPYSFYRDFIRPLNRMVDTTVKTTIFRALMALNLTDKQLQLVKLTFLGYTQKKIKNEMQLRQSNQCEMWNGSLQYPCHKRYGGIHKKFLQYLEKSPKFKQYLETQQLKYKDGKDGNIRKEESK